MKNVDWYLALTTKLTTEIEFRPKVKEVVTEVNGISGWQEKLKQKALGYFCQSGIIKSPNQDDISVIINPEMVMIAVSDGHGPSGHYCSYIVQQMLPRFVFSSPHYPHDISRALNDSFVFAHEALKEIAEKQETFNVSMSGTTFTLVLHDEKNKKLFISHVGDSRAIIAKRRDTKIVVKSLTNDHNMNDSKEYTRIMVAEGDIKQADKKGPLRFYCKGTNYPGLAISRSIGDSISKIYGVICKPDISEIDLTSDDLLVVIASDGVWEKMSNEEVIEIAQHQGRDNAQQAAKKVVTHSQRLWRAENTLHCDDITCVVYWI
jgi:serine/threonine protein phosphatase PrpC